MISLKSPLNYFKSKRFIGCDLGASCLKVVKLEKIDGGVSLIGKVAVKVLDAIGDDSRSREIQQFLRKNNFVLDGQTAVNIEDVSLLIRHMELPKMPERDTKTAIRWNFREFVSGPIEDHIVSYLPVVGAGEGEKFSVSAFCVSRHAVEVRQALMKNAGIRVSSVEPNATALLAAFNYCLSWERDRYYAVLDLGDSISNFIVVGNGSLMFSRPLSRLSGRNLVDLISKALGMSRDDADEKLKGYLAASGEDKAVSSGPDAEKIESAVSNFISQLIVDVQRSIDAFCIMYKKDKVDRIYLCGGGICLPNIVTRFSSGLGVDADLFNPFKNISNAETAVKMNTAPMYAVAVGLAMPGE